MTEALLVDTDADLFGLSGNHGGIFRVDLDTGDTQPIATDPQWVAPVDVLGTLPLLWVVDISAGHIWQVLVTEWGQQHSVPVYPAPPFVKPSRWELVNGDAVIIDPYANPLGLAQPRTGAAFTAVLPPANPVLRHATPAFVGPSDILELDDLEYILDADAQPVQYAPSNGWTPEGCLWRRGSGYEVVASSADWISPLAMCLITDGQFAGKIAVLDANAGVLTTGDATGKLFLVDPVTGDVTLVTDNPQLADPVDIRYAGNGKVWVTDLNSDFAGFGWDKLLPPLGFSTFGRGGVYEIDLATGAIRFLVSDPTMVSPMRLRPAA